MSKDVADDSRREQTPSERSERGTSSSASSKDYVTDDEARRHREERTGTGTVVSYVRYADGTLLEVLTATPNEGGRYGRKKWIHVVRVVRPTSSMDKIRLCLDPKHGKTSPCPNCGFEFVRVVKK